MNSLLIEFKYMLFQSKEILKGLFYMFLKYFVCGNSKLINLINLLKLIF